MIHFNQVVQPFLCLKDIEPVLTDPNCYFESSDRARLKAMRLNGSKREKKTSEKNDFWQKLHSSDSPLQRQRSIQHGMQHWFYNSADESQARNRYSQSSINSMRDLKAFWSESDKSRIVDADDKNYMVNRTSLMRIDLTE